MKVVDTWDPAGRFGRDVWVARIIVLLLVSAGIAGMAWGITFVGLYEMWAYRCEAIVPTPHTLASLYPDWVGPTTFSCDTVDGPSVDYKDTRPLILVTIVVGAAGTAIAAMAYVMLLRPWRHQRGLPKGTQHSG